MSRDPSPITVLAVHGNGGGAFRFALLPEDLGDGVAFRALTLPGFEGRPLPAGEPTVETFTSAILAEVERVDERCVVLGHGIGGSLALDAVGRGPAGVDGLILHAPVGAHLDTRLFPRVMSSRAVRTAIQYGISAWPTRVVGRRLLFRSAPDGYTDRFLREYRRCAAFQPMFDLLTPTWFAARRPVELPAVLLWGEQDRVLRSSHIGEFERLLPVAETVIEPGWGHFPMIDEPLSYASRIAELARRLVASAAAP